MELNLDALVKERIDALLREVEAHVRAVALAAVGKVLAPEGATLEAARSASSQPVSDGRSPSEPTPEAREADGSSPSPPSPAAGRATTAGRAAVRRPTAPRVGQRSADIERTLLAHLDAHPGRRTEELARELGIESARLKPVLKRLVRNGTLRTSGSRRLTTYRIRKTPAGG
jgi:hypothetical protein